MKMQWIFSVIGFCVLGSSQVLAEDDFLASKTGTCTGRERRRLQKCSHSLERHNAEYNIRCRKIRQAVDCMDRLIPRCSSTLRTGTLSRFNTIRADLMEICVFPNELETQAERTEEEIESVSKDEIPVDSSCPTDYHTILQHCVVDLDEHLGNIMGSDHVSQEQCSHLYGSLDCVVNIFVSCAYQSDLIDVWFSEGQIRGYIQSYCT